MPKRQDIPTCFLPTKRPQKPMPCKVTEAVRVPEGPSEGECSMSEGEGGGSRDEPLQAAPEITGHDKCDDDAPTPMQPMMQAAPDGFEPMIASSKAGSWRQLAVLRRPCLEDSGSDSEEEARPGRATSSGPMLALRDRPPGRKALKKAKKAEKADRRRAQKEAEKEERRIDRQRRRDSREVELAAELAAKVAEVAELQKQVREAATKKEAQKEEAPKAAAPAAWTLDGLQRDPPDECDASCDGEPRAWSAPVAGRRGISCTQPLDNQAEAAGAAAQLAPSLRRLRRRPQEKDAEFDEEWAEEYDTLFEEVVLEEAQHHKGASGKSAPAAKKAAADFWEECPEHSYEEVFGNQDEFEDGAMTEADIRNLVGGIAPPPGRARRSQKPAAVVDEPSSAKAKSSEAKRGAAQLRRQRTDAEQSSDKVPAKAMPAMPEVPEQAKQKPQPPPPKQEQKQPQPPPKRQQKQPQPPPEVCWDGCDRISWTAEKAAKAAAKLRRQRRLRRDLSPESGSFLQSESDAEAALATEAPATEAPATEAPAPAPTALATVETLCAGHSGPNWCTFQVDPERRFGPYCCTSCAKRTEHGKDAASKLHGNKCKKIPCRHAARIWDSWDESGQASGH